MYLNRHYMEDMELPIPDSEVSRDISMTESETSRREIITDVLKEREHGEVEEGDIKTIEEDIKNIVKARKENFLKYYKTLTKERHRDGPLSADKRKASLAGNSLFLVERPSTIFSPTINNNRSMKQVLNFRRKSFNNQQKDIDPSFMDDLQETRQKFQKKDLEVHKLNVAEIEERYRNILGHKESGMNIDKDTISTITVYYRENKKKDWIAKKVDFPADKPLKELKAHFLNLIDKKPVAAFKFKGALMDDDDSSVSSSDLIDEDENKKVKTLDSTM